MELLQIDYHSDQNPEILDSKSDLAQHGEMTKSKMSKLYVFFVVTTT